MIFRSIQISNALCVPTLVWSRSLPSSTYSVYKAWCFDVADCTKAHSVRILVRTFSRGLRVKTLVKQLKQYDGRLGAYKAVCVAVRYGQQWCVALQHISSMCVCWYLCRRSCKRCLRRRCAGHVRTISNIETSSFINWICWWWQAAWSYQCGHA